MLAIALLPAGRDSLVRQLSLVLMVVQFVLTAVLYVNFDGNVAGLQFESRVPWIPGWGVYYQIGLDGMNVLLVLLTAFLGPLVVAGAFSAITKDVKLFYAMVFFIQFAMMGAFVAQDLFLFYVFWETMLIPMFLIIGIWGGERRIYATLKFVLYTAFGSILMLAALIYLVWSLQSATGVVSFAFADLYQVRLPLPAQTLLLGAFALSFAIKVPMFPLHTWLPDAHVEAPTAGSVILAGVLLKMGTYGFVRFSLPILPDATWQCLPWVAGLAIVGIVYGALVAMAQKDMKKLVAYSSVSHMGFVMLGLFALNTAGLGGGILQMLNHGLSTGALFLLVGVIYERRHTRMIAEYGGLSKQMPVFATIFLIITMSSIGLPTLNGFVGEFTILVGAFQRVWWWGVMGGLGIVLGAAYMLWMYQRVFFGPLANPDNEGLADLNRREIWYLVPLVLLCFWIGLYPKPIFDVLEKPVDYVVRKVDPAYAGAVSGTATTAAEAGE
jgi:NADH-quinone oxidoreductase subunit M